MGIVKCTCSSPKGSRVLDLETGCPKLTIEKISVPIFKGRQQHTELTTINMYLLIKIRHDIILQYHGNYIEVKIVGCMLAIKI